MSGWCDKRQIVCMDIKIDTVHHRTKFVVGSCEKRAADAVQQHLWIHNDCNCVIIQRLLEWISIPFLSDKIIFTVLEMDKDFQVFVIDIKSKRLFRQFLQRIEQNLGRNSEKSGTFWIHHLNRSNQTCFSIRSCYSQFITIKVEQEAVEDR